MIGVCAHAADHDVVREFFELFKTPWEFFRTGARYDTLLICDHSVPVAPGVRLIVTYGNEEHPWDASHGIYAMERRDSAILHCRDDRLPIYHGCLLFQEGGDPVAGCADSGRAAVVSVRHEETIHVRLGFNLVSEIRFLLTRGQPVSHAGTPTLDYHIDLLRKLILNAGLPLAEIPPVPDGYDCIACLTHDVDHPSIRLHGFDHTTAGFLRRAVVDSLWRFVRGRLPLHLLLRNYLAAIKLPLIQLGLAKDLWLQFDRYMLLERGLGSTFYVLPFSATPGRSLTGSGFAPKRRASAYGVADIVAKARALRSAGAEVALHGIDAWTDPELGRTEKQQLAAVIGADETGVRMHWLFFDEKTPRALEQAGFTYDSTVGYNNTVGYRSGTGQVFKPLGASQLLELPLHIMDTALFFPSHLNATIREARNFTRRILEFATRFGGTVTVNWHDRSIFPERNWDTFYLDLIEALRRRNAWFPTASYATSWFRARRSAEFFAAPTAHERTHIIATVNSSRNHLPQYRLRIHAPRAGLLGRRAILQDTGDFKDISFAERAASEVAQRLPISTSARGQESRWTADSLLFSN